MAISDELSEEERAIMVFLTRYFEESGMPNALWILNESENIWDVRAILAALPRVLQDARTTLIASYGPISDESLSPLQRLHRHQNP